MLQDGDMCHQVQWLCQAWWVMRVWHSCLCVGQTLEGFASASCATCASGRQTHGMHMRVHGGLPGWCMAVWLV